MHPRASLAGWRDGTVVYHSTFPRKKPVPRFSFVIPATRPHLLKYSVGSALRQSISDFEIILSDNSIDGFRDGIDFEGDSRVRYVRPERRLPHYRSWEFAFSQARGEWIILLGDDDVVLPCTLAALIRAERANPGVEILSWTHGSFFSDSFPSAQRGTASLPRSTGDMRLSSNADSLATLFRVGGEPEKFSAAKRLYPSPLVSAYRSGLVARVRTIAGAFFMPSTPDWAAGVAAMAVTAHTLFIDAPLTILNATADSNAAGGAGDLTKVREAYRELDFVPFTHVPFKGIIANRNIVIDTMLEVRARMPRELGQFEVDWAAYFKSIHFGLAQVRRQSGGFPELAQEEQELMDCIASQSPDVQASVRKYMAASDHAPAGERVPAARNPRFHQLKVALYQVRVAMLVRFSPITLPLLRRRLNEEGVSMHARMAGIRDILHFCQLAGRLLEVPAATKTDA